MRADVRLISTRGAAPEVDVPTGILTGLAPDGGLYVPRQWPEILLTTLEPGMTFAQVVALVLAPYTNEMLRRSELEVMAADVFSQFDHEAVAPIIPLDEDLFLMELFWGPTLAFKDFAMQMLGRLFDRALAARGGNAMIIGATSGDTGSAAMEAFRDRSLVDVVILHPAGRTTEVQRRQMTTIEAANVHAVAVDGTFDDCQDLVKAAFADDQLRSQLSFSTANSINFGRLITQFAYYYWAAVRVGGRVSFAVPSGNFGNVYSGYAASAMGADIHRLIVGSNQNNVLDGFFQRGVLDLGVVVPTITPSMDIQVPSNLERLLFELYERDGDRLAVAMHELRDVGTLEVPQGSLTEEFVSEWYDDASTKMIMADVYRATGRVVDPHTAIGIGAARASGVEGPIVCMGTAHPSKFPTAVEEATGLVSPLPDRLADLHDRPERMTHIANDLDELKRLLRSVSRFG